MAKSKSKTGAGSAVSEHEAEQVRRANEDGFDACCLRPRAVVAPEQLGSLARRLQGGRLRDPGSRVAGRPRDGRRGEARTRRCSPARSIGEVADHFEDVIGELDDEAGDHRSLVRRAAGADPRRTRPVVGVGGHRRCAVPRRPAAADLGAAGRRHPCSSNPANRDRAVPLTYEQFRYGFANAVSEEEAKELYETYAVPASGEPLFQAAAANLNPWTEAKVDTKNPERGPLLIIDGERTTPCRGRSPRRPTSASSGNQGVTEIVPIPDRGHSLTIDSGWQRRGRQVARVRQEARTDEEVQRHVGRESHAA